MQQIFEKDCIKMYIDNFKDIGDAIEVPVIY